MKKAQIFILLPILIAMSNCQYTGGYDIVKGSKAIKEISKNLNQYSYYGTLYYISVSDVACPSSSSAKIVTETEYNDTYKHANQFDFLTEGQSTRIQGTITTAGSDVDIFYTVVPSDSTYTTLYAKAVGGSGNGGCTIDVNTDGSELNNDTYIYNYEVTQSYSPGSDGESIPIQSSYHIFAFCISAADNDNYDLELSLTELGSPSTVSTEIFTNTEYQLSSSTLGPTVFEISSGIDKNKYYTRSSVDECKKKLDVTVPVASILDGYNLLLYVYCGVEYKKINPYFVGGAECKLQEADWIQIGDLGIP